MSRKDDDDERAAEAEAREIERSGVDERQLTPVGMVVPRIGFVSEHAVNVVRFAWLGAWIALFAAGQTVVALVVMFAWIGATGAWEKHRQQLRRERKRQIQQHLARGGALGAVPGAAELPRAPQALPPADPSAPPVAAAGPEEQAGPVSPVERALARTLRRVEGSDRFERRDVALVAELAEVLFPLLRRVTAPGADAVVRQDVEKIATEHLPDSVEAFLALPAERVSTSRNTAGRTPLEELRSQLDLLLTGCEQLQEAVLRADVSRQQVQSRFLEQKFRPSSLDL